MIYKLCSLSIVFLHLNYAVVVSASDVDSDLHSFCSSSILDRLDLDAILKNDRLVSSYFNCFMDEGPCTAEGKRVKEIIPEIVRTQCRDCNPPMKRAVRKIMKSMFQNRPKDFEKFFHRYDPHEMYIDELIEFMGDEEDANLVDAPRTTN